MKSLIVLLMTAAIILVAAQLNAQQDMPAKMVRQSLELPPEPSELLKQLRRNTFLLKK